MDDKVKHTKSIIILYFGFVIESMKYFNAVFNCDESGFGGLEVACWHLEPKFAVSNPAEAVGFFRAKKNPQHAFLR
jgi:hypothetical protein